MSFSSLTCVLAITAGVCAAESSRLAELISLQSEMQDGVIDSHHAVYEHHALEGHHGLEGHHPLTYDHDLAHAHFNDVHRNPVHFNEAGMRHEPMPEDGECPAGYTRIGCCKCILSPHADNDHIAADREHEADRSPVIHGTPETLSEHEREKDARSKKEAKEEEEPVVHEEAPKRSKFHMSTSEEQTKTKREVKPYRHEEEHNASQKKQKEEPERKKPEPRPEDDPKK